MCGVSGLKLPPSALRRDQKMNTISLTVTKGVIDHLGSGDRAQRQLAIRHVSDQFRSALTAQEDNPVYICLGGYLNLAVGDTGAIWRTHDAESGGV